MNGDANEPAAGERKPDLAKAQQELADALKTIMADDCWEARALSSPLLLSHQWADGTVDTLAISSARAAYGYRENAAGIEVKKFMGSAEKVAASLRALPAPGEPGAPDGTDHTPGPNGMWRP